MLCCIYFKKEIFFMSPNGMGFVAIFESALRITFASILKRDKTFLKHNKVVLYIEWPIFQNHWIFILN